MREILIACWDTIASTEQSDQQRLVAVGAWMILPGLIVALSKRKDGGPRVVDALNELAASSNVSLVVMNRCR